MTLALALSAMTVLAVPDVGVALTKRSGVETPTAMARATAVSRALGLATGPADLTACQARLPCLMSEARTRKWETLATVETANVLNEALVTVRLYSVEDSRELVRGSARGDEAALGPDIEQAVGKVRSALEARQKSRAAPPAPVTALPSVERSVGAVTTSDGSQGAGTPAPTPASPATPQPGVSAAPPPSRGPRFAAWLFAGTGAAAIGSGVLFGLSANASKRAFSSAATLEEKRRRQGDTIVQALVADVSFVLGAACAVTALVLFAVNSAPERPATALSFSLLPGGGAMSQLEVPLP
ncbi:MAG: hypothetical protein INH41_18645 [Myxococcaceae bacterium]|nr:hypothetical protein [Myxococcaceae bacterium]